MIISLENITNRLTNSVQELRRFFDEAFPLIYSYFFQRCGGSRQVAEDLTQDTFLAAARQLSSRRGPEAPMPWLYGIARHNLIDYYEGQAREERKLELAWDAARSADEAVDARALSAERARTALARVPAHQRMALALRYLDDLPVRQVAEAIGRTVHATESLLARGRESFRRAYTEDQHD